MAEETLAKMVIKYSLEIYIRPQGRPPSTWISAIKNNLKEPIIYWDEAIETSANKHYW